jgi:hypothetical protein
MMQFGCELIATADTLYCGKSIFVATCAELFNLSGKCAETIFIAIGRILRKLQCFTQRTSLFMYIKGYENVATVFSDS